MKPIQSQDIRGEERDQHSTEHCHLEGLTDSDRDRALMNKNEQEKTGSVSRLLKIDVENKTYQEKLSHDAKMVCRW